MVTEDIRLDVVAGMRTGPCVLDKPTVLGELASGVDALYLSGHSEVPSGLVGELEEAREAAGSSKTGALYELDGRPFRLLPHGWGRYRFVLVNEMGRIGVTTSSHLPALRIQPTSSFLHAVGAETAVQLLSEMVGEALGEVTFSTSRLDLYVDVTG